MNAEKPIYFVRHGDYEDSHPDDRVGRLTEPGIEEARRAAQALAEVEGDITLLTSSAERTMETAEVIGKVLGIEPHASDELYEHGNFATEMLYSGDLEQLLADGLAESGISIREIDRLIVVNHLPLMGLVKGLRARKIELVLTGEVVRYDPGTWIPLAEWSTSGPG